MYVCIHIYIYIYIYIPLQDGLDRITHCKLVYETTTVVFSWCLNLKYCKILLLAYFFVFAEVRSLDAFPATPTPFSGPTLCGRPGVYVYVYVWSCMSIYVNIYSYMVIYKDTWLYTHTYIYIYILNYRNMWSHMIIYDHVWQYMIMYEHI